MCSLLADLQNKCRKENKDARMCTIFNNNVTVVAVKILKANLYLVVGKHRGFFSVADVAAYRFC